MNRTVLMLTIVIGVGCSGRQVDKPGDGAPLSALPRLINEDSDAFCGEDVGPLSPQQYDPSLAAWVAAAETIFVGTIKSVHHVDGPVRYYCYDGAQTLPDVTHCPHAELILRAIEIEFEEVETLHGVDVGSTVSIQMGPVMSSDYPGIEFAYGSPFPTDRAGNRVYRPGSRVGALLSTDALGVKRWNHQQFEVLNDRVYLGDVDRSPALCSRTPNVLGIPDALDGVSLAEFQAAIESAPRPLTDGELAAVEVHFGRVDALASGDYTMTTCGCKDRPVDWEDPTVPQVR